MRTTAMIMLIILAAVFLNFILGFIGVTQELIQFIEALGWTPLETMIAQPPASLRNEPEQHRLKRMSAVTRSARFERAFASLSNK